MKIFKAILKQLFLLGLFFFGACALLAGQNQARLAQTTALTPAQIAGFPDEVAVRSSGHLWNPAPLTPAAGQPLALQKLLIESTERRIIGGRYASKRNRIYSRSSEGELWLRPSNAPQSTLGADWKRDAIEIQLPRLWDGDQIYLPSLSGEVGNDGLLPPAIEKAVAREFSDRPAPRPGQTWTLWTIAQKQKVAVFGQVQRKNGRAIIGNIVGEAFTLTPDFSESARRSTNMSWSLRVAGVLIMAMALSSWIRPLLHRRRAARSGK